MRNVIEWTLRPSACPSVRLSFCPSVPLAAGSGIILLWTQLALRNCHAWLGLYFGCAMPSHTASYRPHFINTFANTPPGPRPCPVWVNYAKKPIKPAWLYKGLAVTLSCPLPAMDTTKWRLTKSEVMRRNEGDIADSVDKRVWLMHGSLISILFYILSIFSLIYI